MKTIFVFLLLCLYGISMQAARPDKSDKIAPRWKNGPDTLSVLLPPSPK